MIVSSDLRIGEGGIVVEGHSKDLEGKVVRLQSYTSRPRLDINLAWVELNSVGEMYTYGVAKESGVQCFPIHEKCSAVGENRIRR